MEMRTIEARCGGWGQDEEREEEREEEGKGKEMHAVSRHAISRDEGEPELALSDGASAVSFVICDSNARVKTQVMAKSDGGVLYIVDPAEVIG